MPPIRDRRPRLLAAVMRDKKLSYREKVYLFAVLSLAAEHVDGRLRKGSKAIGADGKYALHVDYIARNIGKSENAVREARENLESSGWLSRVHEGTHGRPACYQVLLNTDNGETVRVRFFYSLTDSENPHPYKDADQPVRVRKTPTLTYRGGTQPNHSGSRPSPRADGTEGNEDEPAFCDWHLAPVGVPCANCEDGRRTA